jgi:hypothetical protein
MKQQILETKSRIEDLCDLPSIGRLLATPQQRDPPILFAPGSSATSLDYVGIGNSSNLNNSSAAHARHRFADRERYRQTQFSSASGRRPINTFREFSELLISFFDSTTLSAIVCRCTTDGLDPIKTEKDNPQVIATDDLLNDKRTLLSSAFDRDYTS